MKITVLGCGSSGGVPLIGNVWGACDPAHPRNRRTRVSILVQKDDTTVLVDTSPDLRQQLLACNLQTMDAVLYTHAHADHTHGIDELRSVNWLTRNPIDLYADPATLAELRAKFSYVFHEPGRTKFYAPSVLPHEISGAFQVGALDIVPFYQNHGSIRSLGYRFGNFAYSTDVWELDDEAFEILRGTKTWIVDCVRAKPHNTHAHLQKTLSWIERVKPERAFLTHMNESMDYATLIETLPAGILPAYDGLVLEC